MAKDFFDELSGTLSKKAQSLTERVNSVYETQKLRSRIAGEERMAEKLMTDIGRIVYSRFLEGGEVDSDLVSLCEEIKGHEDAADELKADAAGKKGQKICPACKKEVDKYASFCPYCGTPVPDPEPEEEEEPEFEEIPGNSDAEDAPAEDEDAEEVTAPEEAAEETEEAVPEEAEISE